MLEKKYSKNFVETFDLSPETNAVQRALNIIIADTLETMKVSCFFISE